MSWEIIYPVGAFALVLGIAYGVCRTRQRTPREKAITEVATTELYRHPDRYVAGTRQALSAEAQKAKDQAKRS